MARTNVTTDVQNSPTRTNAGKLSADATIIDSGFDAGTITYQIRRRDRANFGTTDADGTLSFTSSIDHSISTMVVSITAVQLQIILPFRTEFQVRVTNDSVTWTDWVSFKTRNKRYQSPDAITLLTDDSSLTVGQNGNRIINVTNSAKATEVITAAGSTVTNTDNGYVATTSNTATAAGATVVNSDPYQAPTGNVTIG